MNVKYYPEEDVLDLGVLKITKAGKSNSLYFLRRGSVLGGDDKDRWLQSTRVTEAKLKKEYETVQNPPELQRYEDASRLE